ncbi:MAG: hypothetical protein UMS36scaffold28_5 [Phage 59_13]|nr:MAG: hypothetical protein UMS36scaffold28_5 [Phage 59_13]
MARLILARLIEGRQWSTALRRVVNLFPAVVKSKNWPEIMRLANGGDFEAARELAAKSEVSPDVARRNIVARKLRIVRVELFSRIARAQRDLRVQLDAFAKNVSSSVIKNGKSLGGLKTINVRLHDEMISLRRTMNSWFLALVKDGAKMGFRHAGDALLPIFRDNREVTTDIIAGQALFEAKLSFALKKDFANRTSPKVATGSAFWAAKQSRIIRSITKTNLQGLTPSERIWELTKRTESDLKRIIANDIAAGKSPYLIAKKIEKYVSPAVGNADALGVEAGPGVYRSPYRNAMRLARTETNRAYTQASAEFATQKDWLKGMQITLSPAHAEEDECDDHAGDVVTPEEFVSLVPFHPHCMCFGSFVIDPKFLGEE